MQVCRRAPPHGPGGRINGGWAKCRPSMLPMPPPFRPQSSYRQRPHNQVQSSFYPRSRRCELRNQASSKVVLPNSDQMCSFAGWRPPLATKDTKTPQTPFLTDHPSGSLLGLHVLKCVSRNEIFRTMNHRTRTDVKKAVDQRRRRDGYDTNHQGR